MERSIAWLARQLHATPQAWGLSTPNWKLFAEGLAIQTQLLSRSCCQNVICVNTNNKLRANEHAWVMLTLHN